MSGRPLLSTFERRDFEHRAALIFLGERITYGQLAAEARRVAAGLQSLGLRKGDLVALHFRNCPQFLASHLACWWIGAVAVPIRHSESAAMVISWCNYLKVSCLLVQDVLVEKVAPHLSELASCRAVISSALAPGTSAILPWSVLVDNDGDFQHVTVNEREPGLIVHTSGSTARPKAVAQHLHGMYARVCAQLEHLPFSPDDVVCVFSDLSHGFGLNVLAMPTFAVGATLLVVPYFEPLSILREMVKQGVTITGGAPAYLDDLLHAARQESPATKLRFAITSADKCPAPLQRAWGEVFKAPLLEAFGITEAFSGLFMNRPDDICPGTVGRPIPGLRVRIVGPDGDVPEGSVGELWLAGEYLFAGYWNDPDATQRAMVGDWYRTGDQAIRDHEGRYRIVGRTGFMIKRGGIPVSPFEVEAALAEHPAIAESLVRGVPNEKWGQEVEAFVVLRHRISVADLHAHAAATLGEPHRPVRFWMVPAIPKTSLGKVMRSDTTNLRASAQLLTE
jgi:long-chain acyl-CoA synthetase